MPLSPWIVWGLSSNGRRSDNRIPQFKNGSIRLRKNWQWKWTYWLEPHQGSLKNRGPRPLFSGGPNEVHGPSEFSHWSHGLSCRTQLRNPSSSRPPHALVLNGGLKKPRCASAKTRTKRFLRIWVTYKSSVSLSACLDTVQLPHPAGHLSWCNRFIR